MPSVSSSTTSSLLDHARAALGFMPPDEGDFLLELASRQAPLGPLLEVGTYCGKSALYLAAAAQPAGQTVFTVDHHRGSEENQAGWEHHDHTLVDSRTGRMDTLPVFRATIEAAGAEDTVVAIIAASTTVSRHWHTPLSLLFIDGGHAEEHAQNDYSGWAPWVQPGGLLVIHDVFERPEDGGQPPFHVWQRAVAGGSFTPVGQVGSMRALQRVAGEAGDPVG